MGSRKILVPVAALLVAMGCDEDDVLGDGTVVGRVEATTQPFADLAPLASAGRAPLAFATRASLAFAPRAPAAAPRFQVGPGTQAATAVIGRFDSDGDLRGLASGDVGADARFRVTGVPAGRTRLIAEVRDASGDAIGRSIIHVGPDEGGVVPVAAINGETTAEANVFAALIEGGVSQNRIATPDLAAKLEFANDGEAREAAVSTAEIAALATAFLAAQTAFLDALGRFQAGVDAGDLQRAGAEAATNFARQRDEGVDERQAELAFLAALAEGYADARLSFEAQAIAGSSAIAAAVAATADESAELTLLRGAGTQMGAARALLAIVALTGLGGTTADAQAVSEAFVALDTVAGAAMTASAVLAAFDAFQAALLETFTEVATARLGLSATVVANLIQAISVAPFQATLAADLAAATDVTAIVNAYLAFYDALRDLVVDTLTTAGVPSADAELAADVFVAAESGLAAIFP